MRTSELLRAFDAWESRLRGSDTRSYRVGLEPAFEPLLARARVRADAIDDGRRQSGALRLWGAEAPTLLPSDPPEASVPEPADSEREIVELELLLPDGYAVKPAAARSFLSALQGASGAVGFELVGLPKRISAQLGCGVQDVATVRSALKGYFPEAKVRERQDFVREEWDGRDGFAAIVPLGLDDRVFKSLNTEGRLDIDPLIDIVAALNDLSDGELGLVQVLFSPAHAPWRTELETFASSIDDVDRVLPLIRAKFSEPLFAVSLRVAALAPDEDRAIEIAQSLAHALYTVTRSEANELTVTDASGHSLDVEAEDLLDRATHRSGMLLSLSELLTLVHPPTASVRSEHFVRQGSRTKVAPERSLSGSLLLGTNTHDGETRDVWLSVEDRLRHTYLIGASGTGKSTLLLSMAEQDIAAGNGFAVLDPHGDLIDDILARVPESRAGDVVLIDPADEEYPVGFNILSAHSDLERTLLASDLVATFRRFSTTFGDQMVSVLGNAVLAFLESSRGGTLLDLRRLLLEKPYRTDFLKTVEDEEVVSYWESEFPLLKGNPQASILTRLNTFLRPKLIRYMVAQKEDRLDMRAIMDSRKIVLARLSQGAIGEENAHLLGSLLVAKIAQAAMSRQDAVASARVPFFVYIDEFHHFITPSIATILSGARKYGVGLTLAHQELRQVKSRSEDVLSAVLGNAHVRVAFRVAEQDAKSLADGFAAFESADLQRLGRGHAIARIERSDFDFNLETRVVSAVEPSVAAAQRERAVDVSRARYATPRAEVEALLRRNAAEAAAAHVEPSITSPTSTRRVKQAPIPGAEPGNVAGTMPGRGGTQHKYLQSLVRKLAEDRGFDVSVEEAVLDGHGHIDVALRREGLSIACEISVTTRAEHEAANLFKGLAAGFDYAVLLSSDPRTLDAARLAMARAPDPRFVFLAPSGFPGWLHEICGAAERVGPSSSRRQASGIRKSQPTGANAPADSNGRSTRLPAAAAAEYLGLATQTLAKFRVTGESPPYIKVGRQVFYERLELDAWLDKRRRRSTSDSYRPASPST